MISQGSQYDYILYTVAYSSVYDRKNNGFLLQKMKLVNITSKRISENYLNMMARSESRTSLFKFYPLVMSSSNSDWLQK